MGFGIGDILGAVSPLAGSILGANKQKKGIKKAEAAQAAATEAAIAEQRRQYDLARGDMAPWRETGELSLSKLAHLLGLGSPSGTKAPLSGMEWLKENASLYPADNTGQKRTDRIKADYAKYRSGFKPGTPQSGGDFGSLLRPFAMSDFWGDPVTQASYQSGLDLGEEAIDRMAGSRGMRYSGQTLKDLLRFGTDYTGRQAGDSYNRYTGRQTDTYNKLSGVAGTGQTAASNTGGYGMSTGQRIADLISNMGNARGAAAIAKGNIPNAGQQIFSTIGQLAPFFL